MKKFTMVIGAALLAVSATQSSAALYNFKAAANAGGGIGESIFSVFNTNLLGVGGPNLQITATGSADDDNDQFVYFDDGNAGMGVCKDALNPANINVATNGFANQCDPGSDDGITGLDEALHFEANEGDVVITSIFLNANHDPVDVKSAIYKINNVDYGIADMVDVGGGDVRIDLNFVLLKGQSFTLFPTTGRPDSYVSAIEVNTVPLPASALLLVAGLGGFGLMSRKRKA